MGGLRSGGNVSEGRAWLGVYRTRPAIAIIATCAVCSFLLRDILVFRAFTQWLVAPLALPVFITCPAGIAVAIGCIGPPARLPDPPRVKLARGLWAVFLMALAAGACILGTLGGGPGVASAGIVIRNVLVFATLSLAAVIAGWTSFAWLLPLMLVLVGIQFGVTGDGGYPWWAVFLAPQANGRELLVAALAFSGVVLVYALRPPVTRRE